MPDVPFHLETVAVVNSSLCLNFHLKESENTVSLTITRESLLGQCSALGVVGIFWTREVVDKK